MGVPLVAKAAPLLKPDQVGEGPCHYCKKIVGSGAYCFGCKVHICDACDVNPDMPWGQHDPDTHRDTSEPDELEP